MKSKLLTVLTALAIGSGASFAQINVGNIKKPKVNLGKTPAISKYDKYIKEAKEAESKEDYIAAYKAYNKALEEKNNDYSAKTSRTNIEGKAIDQYKAKLNALIDEKDCGTFKSTVDDLMGTISLSSGEKASWEKTREECEIYVKEGENKKLAEQNKAEYEKLNKACYFFNEYDNKSFIKQTNVGDDLWMNIKMDKTMMEYSADFGINESFNAYGFFVIYMDGKKVATTNPLHFTSNYSKSWTNFDVPLSIDQDYGTDKNKVEKLMGTPQGIWVVSNLQNADLVNRVFVLQAIKNLKTNGEHTVKIEFGLGEKGAKEPKGIITSGEMKIMVTDEGKKNLYKKGPKYLRPLDDNEVGTITTNMSSFKLGQNALTATFNLPYAPKYYAQKWCTTMSCDYDHGDMTVVVLIDGIEVVSGAELWNDKWETQKSFTYTMIPKNDNELDNDLASFNQEDFSVKTRNNKIVYGLVDLLYQKKVGAGSHKVTIQFVHEVVVGNDAIANEIASQDFTLNITQAQINAFIASSNAKKLSHAGGAWTSIDNTLKSKYASDRVVDVACMTEWKVARNVYGVILYRTCRADILYKTSSGGYRIMQGVEIKADYNGAGYDKPYIVGHFRTDWGISALNSAHFPVPAAKVK
ncbi:MAG: hypothetical protein ACWA41_01585 [Putridiphycobacter sp.]